MIDRVSTQRVMHQRRNRWNMQWDLRVNMIGQSRGERAWTIRTCWHAPPNLRLHTPSRDRPTGGLERFDNLFFGHLLIHPIEQQLGSLALICGGVLEKFPRLRTVFLEAGGGWIIYWLERMDRDYHQLGFLVPELKRSYVAVPKRNVAIPPTRDVITEDAELLVFEVP